MTPMATTTAIATMTTTPAIARIATLLNHTQYSTEKTPDKIMPVQANTNAFGKRIALHLCNGLIFCIYWADTNLDKDYLSISISEDGHCVIQKQAKPIPKDATELIKKFSWSSDSTHYVVRLLDTEVKNVKKALEKDEK